MAEATSSSKRHTSGGLSTAGDILQSGYRTAIHRTLRRSFGDLDLGDPAQARKILGGNALVSQDEIAIFDPAEAIGALGADLAAVDHQHLSLSSLQHLALGIGVVNHDATGEGDCSRAKD